MDTVYLNGEYLPRAEARLPVDDRGFLFGDGVYEVTPAYGGAFLRMPRHMERLRSGLRSLAIDFDVESVPALQEELLERNGLADAALSIVYLQVTRGAAPRTHHFPPKGTRPTVFAYAAPFRRPSREDWEKGFAAITHPDRRWARADIKTVQLLPNVLAQEAARAAGVSDALLIRDGIVLEGSHNNLFFVFGRKIRTHPTSNQILPGITREFVLELAGELGFEVEEVPTPLEEFGEAAELFLTGSTTEIRPIVRVDGRAVGVGEVGPVARELYSLFCERIAEECRVGTGHVR
jgi:D-alanine transaminase